MPSSVVGSYVPMLSTAVKSLPSSICGGNARSEASPDPSVHRQDALAHFAPFIDWPTMNGTVNRKYWWIDQSVT